MVNVTLLVYNITQVHVNSLDETTEYRAIETVTGVFLCLVFRRSLLFVTPCSWDFPIPPLESVGCPVTYKPNDNKYEVNFQWRAPYSQALLRFVRRFRINVFQMQSGQEIPLDEFSPEYGFVNVGVVGAGLGLAV